MEDEPRRFGLLEDTYEMRTRESLEEAACSCCSMDRVNEEVEPRSACSVPEIGGCVLSSCLASFADEFNGEIRPALALGSGSVPPLWDRRSAR